MGLWIWSGTLITQLAHDAASRAPRLHHIWKHQKAPEGLKAQDIEGVICLQVADTSGPCPLGLGPVTLFSGEGVLIQTCCSSLYSCWSLGDHLRMPSRVHFNPNAMLYSRHPWRWWWYGGGSWGTCPGTVGCTIFNHAGLCPCLPLPFSCPTSLVSSLIKICRIQKCAHSPELHSETLSWK